MVLSTMIVKCELMWEHIEGSDLYKGRPEWGGGCSDDLGMVIGRQALIPTWTATSVLQGKKTLMV